MFAVLAQAKRENLFQEISRIVRQWPERDRQVFSQAHYRGQSLEAIARSLQMAPADISTILRQCERRLHASLRNFRKCDGGQSSPVPADSARPLAREKDQKTAPALGLKMNRLPDIYRKSA